MGGIILQNNKYPNRFDNFKMDYVTGVPPYIDNDHAYIHLEKAYTAYHRVTHTGTGITNLLLTTPAETVESPYIHYRPIIVSTSKGSVVIRMFEGSEKTGGTAVTLYNHNRNSSRTAGATLTHTPTGSRGTATQIFQKYIGGGSGQGQTAFGGNAEGLQEWVLKPGTKYELEYDCEIADTSINIEIFFYEEEK